MKFTQELFGLILEKRVRRGKNLSSCLGKSLIFALVFICASCTRTPGPIPSPTPLPPDTPPSESSSPESLIDDLEDGDAKNQLGGYWYTYSDKDNKGDSLVSPSGEFKPSAEGANDSSKSARISGKVTKTYQYGFIGMGTNLAQDNNSAIDLNQYQGIEFCAKGDGKEYRVKLRSLAIKDYNDYGYEFVAPAAWQCYKVLFNQMEQKSFGAKIPLDQALTKVIAIQWQTIGQPHESVDLAVDAIKFLP